MYTDGFNCVYLKDTVLIGSNILDFINDILSIVAFVNHVCVVCYTCKTYFPVSLSTIFDIPDTVINHLILVVRCDLHYVAVAALRAGVTHLISVLGAMCDKPKACAKRSPSHPSILRISLSALWAGVTHLIFNSLVRPPLRYGRRQTALRASLPAQGAGITHLISIIGATSTALRSLPDCSTSVLTRPAGGSHSSYLIHWCDLRYATVAAGLPLGRPYPPKGRASLILFQSQVRPSLRSGRRRTALRASLPARLGGHHSSYLDHWCDLRYAAVATGLPLGRPYPPKGRASLILFKSLVRPSLRCGRRRTALRASLPAHRAGVTHLILIIDATSTALRSPPDCPLGVLTHPAGGRESLILFRSLVRPPLRCGRRRTALRASLPALWAGVTHLI